MRTLQPIRAVRSSGWRSRAAAGIALVGLAAGVVHGGPASASQRPVTINISGHVQITDIDDTSPNDVCDPRLDTVSQVQMPSTAQTHISINRRCDEVRTYLSFDVVAQDGYVDITGTAKGQETDCTIWCTTHELGALPFKVRVNENSTRDMGYMNVGKANLGRVHWVFTITTSS